MLILAAAFAGPAEDLLADVVANDPVSDVLSARIDADAALRPRPRDALFRPVFRDLGSATREPSISLRLRQPLEPPGSLRAARRELDAERADDHTRARLRAAERRATALETYDAGRVASAERGLLDEELALVERRIDVLRLRLDGGLPVAEDLVDATVDRLELVQRRALADLRVAEAAAWLEEAAGRPVALDAEGLAAEVMAPLEAPGSRVPSTGLAAAEAALAARRAERRPFVDWVQAELEPRPGERASYGLAANVEIPIWRFLDGEVAAARERVAVERRAMTVQEDRRSREQEAAVAAWIRHRDALLALQAAQDEAAAALDQLRAQVSPDALLDAQAALLEERRRWWSVAERALQARRLAEWTP
jgi:hypothetical protein